jgi:UDP-N-acetylglucosamine 2-epimerase (non-hydrolysing)
MILLTYGTRPEKIKIDPLIKEMIKFGIPFKTLFTGQHKNIVTNDSDYELDFIEYPNNRLDCIIKNCMSIPESYFDGIKYILVQGDTTSVVGLSLSAIHRKIKVIHLEAGLRSYDTNNPYPEEYNRKLVSSIADIHLCPTENNKENLLKENIEEKKIFVVGNTGLDHLYDCRESISYQNKILITLHRRENHEMMEKWFYEINKLSLIHKDLEFILPIHPNPNVQKHKKILTNINVIEPLKHEELIDILINCKLVITDSGGIQEESSFLKKKCLVCRTSTERTESLEINTFLVKDPSNLIELFDYHLYRYNEINGECPYGNGKSSEKICEIIQRLLINN